MTTVVLDASVVVKWIFADRTEESHSLQALQILQSIKESRLAVVHPPHWLAEVAAVTDVWALNGHVKPSHSCTRWSSLSQLASRSTRKPANYRPRSINTCSMPCIMRWP